MEQIIQAIAAKIGIPEAVARQGVGILLNFIKQKTANTQFEQFAALLPGAGSVMASAPTPGSNTGGGLGGLISAAGGLLGGQAGDIAKVLGSLQSIGIPANQAGPFANAFVDQAKQTVGNDKVDQLLGGITTFSGLLNQKGN